MTTIKASTRFDEPVTSPMATPNCPTYGHPNCSTYGRHNFSDGVAKTFTVGQLLADPF